VKELDSFVGKMEDFKEEISEHIALGKGLKECAVDISEDQKYKEQLAMGRMLQVMRGDRKKRQY
jgi:hypothetical protein